MKKKTAKEIRELSNWSGYAKLFELSEPVKYSEGETKHVIVSAAIVPLSGLETYIFASDCNGEVKSWAELQGSYRGGLDYSQALKNAGYELIKD